MLFHFNQLLSQSINSIECTVIQKLILSLYKVQVDLPNHLLTRSIFNLNPKKEKEEQNPNENNESLYNTFTPNTIHLNRFLPIERIISKLPNYYPLFAKTFQYIFHNKSPLIMIKKVFLGMIAASSLNNKFLFSELEREFIINEGNEEWIIHGLNAVDCKLSKYSRISNILLNQPWLLKKEDIFEIYNPKDPSSNLSEFIESCLIITSFHRLGSIMSAFHLSYKDSKILEDEKEFQKFREKNKIFLSKFKSNYCNVYHDFHNTSYFSEIDYNWEDSGHYFLENYKKELVKLINDELVYLTNENEHNTIEFYIGTILGVTNESYDYSQINKDKSTNITKKIFLKKIVTDPESFSLFDLNLLKIKHTDKQIIYLTLLAAIIKQKIQLTYLSKLIDEIIKE